MAAPTFVAASTGATDAGGAWTYTTHAPGAAGRLFIVHVFQDGTSGNVSITSATNCTNIAGTANLFTTLSFASNVDVVGNPQVGRQYLFLARSSGTSAISITGANSGSDDIYIQAFEFTNVATGTTPDTFIEPLTSNILQLAQSGAGTSTTVADVGVTTTGADRLALNFVALADDAMGLAAFAGETGGDWTLATAIYETATGTDATLGLMQAAMPSAGTINGGTDAITSIGWGVLGFALIGQAATSHTGSVISPFTFGEVVQGRIVKYGRVDSPFAHGQVATAKVTAKGRVDSPFTFGTFTDGDVPGVVEQPTTHAFSFYDRGELHRGMQSTVDAGTLEHYRRGEALQSHGEPPSVAGADVFGEVVSPFTFGEVTQGSRTVRGRVDSPFSFGEVVQGKRTRLGQVVSPFTFGEVVSGKVTAKSRVDSPFTFGAVVAGRRVRLGQVVSPFTFGEVVAAKVTAKSAVVSPFTFGIVTAGRVPGAGGQVASPFTFGRVVQAKVTAKSAVLSPFTFTALEVGRVGAKGRVDSPFTFNRVVNATRVLRGQVVLPFTFGEVAAGRITAKSSVVSPFVFGIVTQARGGAGVVTSPFTFGRVVQGKVTARSAVVSPFTFTALELAKVTAKSRVDSPFSFNRVVNGNVAGRVYGQVVQAFTFGEVVAAKVGAKGAIVSPFTFGEVVNARRVLRGFVVAPFTFGEVVSGRLGAKSTLVSPFTFDRVVDGHRVKLGLVVSPFTFNRVVAAALYKRGRVDLPFTFVEVVNGRLYKRGRIVLPFEFGEVVTGFKSTTGQVVYALVWDVDTEGTHIPRMITLDVITVGRIAMGRAGSLDDEAPLSGQINGGGYGRIEDPDHGRIAVSVGGDVEE